MKLIDDVLVMWEADCEIDDNHLDHASITTAKLHAKYLRVLSEGKLKKTKLEIEYNALRKLKFRYYRGEMSRDELAEHGWDQWQYNKPLKAEMDEFLKGDEELGKYEARLEYMNTFLSTVESILSQIKQRDWQIRNAITWKQFLAGS